MSGEVEAKTKSVFWEVARNKNYRILEMEADRDHTHMLLEAESKAILAKMVQAFKSVSAKKILEDFPQLSTGKGKYFWAKRYGHKEISEKEIEPIREYIRNQKSVHGKE